MTEPLNSEQLDSLAEHNDTVAVPETDADEQTTATGTDTDLDTQNKSEGHEPDSDLNDARLRGDTLYELLLQRSIEQGTDGLLVDASDLSRDGDLYDDNGLPDVAKIRAAAEALVDAKPHLAPVRGDVGQGVRETNSEDTWSTLLRAGFN